MIYKVLVGNEHGGAAESSARLLNNFLTQQNFYVIFLCNSRFSQKYLIEYKNAFCLNINEPPIISASSTIRRVLNSLMFFLWVLRAVKSLSSFINRRSISFIHTTNNHALLVVLLSKIFKPSLHIVSHWRCVGLASAGQYKPLLKRINNVICISKVVKKSLPDFLQAISTVIYDGVDVQSLSKIGKLNKGKFRNNLGINSNTFLTGTIGSFTPIKCHDLLIEAFNNDNIKVLDIKLVLFGSCPNEESEKYLAYLKGKVKKYNLKNQVIFLTDEQYCIPRNYIADLNLFVGATWNKGLGEGFGLIYVEAMAQKLPVVAIQVGAAEEIIVNNHTGFLLEHNSADELIQVILQSYIQRDRIKEMGCAGYEIAKTRFDLSNTVYGISQIYSSLIQ